MRPRPRVSARGFSFGKSLKSQSAERVCRFADGEQIVQYTGLLELLQITEA